MHRVQEETRELKVILVLQEQLVLKVTEAHRVFKVPKELLVSLVHKEQSDLKELKVSQVLVAQLERKVQEDHKGLRVHKEPLDLPVQRAL